MALTILSTGNVLDRGTVANDNTGDTLRTAAQKINTNFETLDSAVTNQTWANASVTNSILRYDGTKFVATDGLLVDTNGNITISGTLSSDSATITGDIAVSGLVDGRDIAADGVTLDSATASNTPHAIVARDGSGNFLAGTITASLTGTATNATNVVINNDTSTNSTHYVHFGSAISGNDGVQVSDSKLTFNPSSGVLSVNGVSVATTADLTASTSPNFSVDSSLFASGILTNGEGKAIYYDTSTNKWEGAYNDSSGEFVASHVIVDKAATDVKIASTGIFTLSGGLNANHYYFLSSTAGTATDNPDIEPKVFQPLYYALDANTIDLNIQAPQDTVITAYSSGNNPGEEVHGGPIIYTGIPSDERLKENIESIQSDAISIVNELNPVSFDFKEPRSKYYEGQQLGFIAQEISEVIPQSVYTENDEIQTMMLKPETVIPVLTKAIQELTVTVETLKRRVEELEGE